MAGEAGVADGFLAGEESFICSVGVVAIEAFTFCDWLMEVLCAIDINVAIGAHGSTGAFVAEEVFFYIIVLVACGAGADCGWAVEELFINLVSVAA